MKQPTLPIIIPTHLFFDDSIKIEGNERENKKTKIFIFLIDNQHVDKAQRRSKRDFNGSIKHEINTDMIDNLTAVNSTQQKKSKTSHVYKQEPAIVSTLISIKDEPNIMSDVVSSNEKSCPGNMATVTPMIVQPKKEKPTAKYV